MQKGLHPQFAEDGCFSAQLLRAANAGAGQNGNVQPQFFRGASKRHAIHKRHVQVSDDGFHFTNVLGVQKDRADAVIGD